MKQSLEKGIPISVSLEDTLESQKIHLKVRKDKKMLLYISACAVGIVLPVISKDNNKLVGILSYKDILSAYKFRFTEHDSRSTHISIKRRALKILSHGKSKILSLKDQKKR